MKYLKEYTQKEWSKFSKKEVEASTLGNDYQFFNFFTQKKESYETMSVQEMMIIKYDVRVTDYKTKKEKFFDVLDKVNVQNLNKGITKFNKGVNSFTKSIESTNKSKSPDLSGLSPKKNKGFSFGISQREYDKLFKSPKRKGNTINFWDEDRKTRKKRNRRRKASPVQKEPDYSALIGKKRMKFF